MCKYAEAAIDQALFEGFLGATKHLPLLRSAVFRSFQDTVDNVSSDIDSIQQREFTQNLLKVDRVDGELHLIRCHSFFHKDGQPRKTVVFCPGTL